MAGGALDSILAVVVPILAFGLFGFLIYRAFPDEIDGLINWIKGIFSGGNSSPADYGGRKKDYYGMDANVAYR